MLAMVALGILPIFLVLLLIMRVVAVAPQKMLGELQSVDQVVAVLAEMPHKEQVEVPIPAEAEAVEASRAALAIAEETVVRV
jgi:hypothetical protein